MPESAKMQRNYCSRREGGREGEWVGKQSGAKMWEINDFILLKKVVRSSLEAIVQMKAWKASEEGGEDRPNHYQSPPPATLYCFYWDCSKPGTGEDKEDKTGQRINCQQQKN